VEQQNGEFLPLVHNMAKTTPIYTSNWGVFVPSVAIAVSETTVGKLDHDETQATLAALSLQAETNNIDSYVSALDQMKEQEIKIQKLTQEFDEL
jgi:hypothetical protein